MKYVVHYTEIRGIDLIIKADSEEEAVEKAENLADDLDPRSLEFGDCNIEVIEKLPDDYDDDD